MERNDGSHPRAEKKNRRYTGVAALLAGLLFAVWATAHFLGRAREAGTSATAVTSPAVPVGVQTVTSRKLRLWNDFSGRLRAVDSAEIRPEVSGRIAEVRFQDGQSVKAGDVLVVIDPRIYEAAVSRAEARIAAAKATLQLTASNETRDSSLLKTRAISQREFDQTDSANNSASAELATAQADLKTAQVDVDHAYVKAPISGRVSRAELTVGNLVQSGTGAPLPTATPRKQRFRSRWLRRAVPDAVTMASCRTSTTGSTLPPGPSAPAPGLPIPTGRWFPACSFPCGWRAAASGTCWSSPTGPSASTRARNSFSSFPARTERVTGKSNWGMNSGASAWS